MNKDDNFNSYIKNEIPNNQPLNNQNFNQNMNVNQQPQPTSNFQQPIKQNPIQQQTNTFDRDSANNQSNNNSPKKMNLGLIIGIVFLVVVGIGIVFASKILSNNVVNNSNGGSSSNEKSNVVYYDNSRNLKDSYTFKEAVSKFAFKVNKTTLIFEEKDKISFDDFTKYDNIYGEPTNVEFYYKQDIYHTLSRIYLGESNSTTLEQFKTNFNNGILSDKTKVAVENVNIIESNNDYVFASWKTSGAVSMYKYYFAKVIGEKVYYVYNNSFDNHNDTKISLLLEEFKQFFTCLSVDDGKEPYIQDKIINVPIVLNKQIKDVNYISFITNGRNDYSDGSVSFASENNESIYLYYGASNRYDIIDWGKSLDSKIKYAKKDKNDLFGIKDNNNTQIFEIITDSNKQIDNIKDFESCINTYFINK